MITQLKKKTIGGHICEIFKRYNSYFHIMNGNKIHSSFESLNSCIKVWVILIQMIDSLPKDVFCLSFYGNV